jgi:hypothetical protein
VTFNEKGTYVVSMTAIDASGSGPHSLHTHYRRCKVMIRSCFRLRQAHGGTLVHGKKISISLSATNTQGSSNTSRLFGRWNADQDHDCERDDGDVDLDKRSHLGAHTFPRQSQMPTAGNVEPRLSPVTPGDGFAIKIR